MSDLNTPDYYRRREAQEQALASKALLPTIAAIHHELAEQYRTLAAQAAADERRPMLRIVAS